MKSFLAKVGEVPQKWVVVDAEGQVLGRLAVKIANILRGRHRPTYTPHTDTGDSVIVINASKVVVTGSKETDKQYMTYSGWRSGHKHRSLAQVRAAKPEHLITHAVKGMMPKNKLAHQVMTKLRVFPGAEHIHAAQNPEKVVLN
jgi:large subunit ribosomal protein L13